jgi:hypothetical protein
MNRRLPWLLGTLLVAPLQAQDIPTQLRDWLAWVLQLLLRVDRGVHRISLRYRIGAADSANLRFALPPQHVVFAGQEWSLDGVDDGRLLASASPSAQATIPCAGPVASTTRRRCR